MLFDSKSVMFIKNVRSLICREPLQIKIICTRQKSTASIITAGIKYFKISTFAFLLCVFYKVIYSSVLYWPTSISRRALKVL